MSVGLLPQNAGATATAVAVLADELAFLSGDRSTDLAWYGKRGLIGGVYASTGEFNEAQYNRQDRQQKTMKPVLFVFLPCNVT